MNRRVAHKIIKQGTQNTGLIYKLSSWRKAGAVLGSKGAQDIIAGVILDEVVAEEGK